ncbi:MAG TPA: MBL fold metallo-hydrolase [Candidatus Aquicultor sp.]|jgi:glyoxylase-like metal-dependent hydrolase (beta-lactamase superfamily II)
MFLETLVVGDLGANCYVLASEHAKETIVIDPGGSTGLIMDTIAAVNLDVKYIILTHAHWDHIAAAVELKKKTGAQIAVHKLDAAALNQPGFNLSSWVGERQEESITPDIELEDGQVIKCGDIEAHVLLTPGHTPGSISIRIANALFTGDLLFYGSIGRTDFAGGSLDALLHAVKTKVLTLPDQVTVYPGHGPATTIGVERRHNPYLQDL